MTALWLANQTRGVVALWKFKRKNPLELRATTPFFSDNTMLTESWQGTGRR